MQYIMKFAVFLANNSIVFQKQRKAITFAIQFPLGNYRKVIQYIDPRLHFGNVFSAYIIYLFPIENSTNKFSSISEFSSENEINSSWNIRKCVHLFSNMFVE